MTYIAQLQYTSMFFLTLPQCLIFDSLFTYWILVIMLHLSTSCFDPESRCISFKDTVPFFVCMKHM